MFKSRQLIIGLIVSLIFFALALVDIKPDQVWSALQKANYWVLIPALALYFAGVVVRAVRWRILLRPVLSGKKTSLLNIFEVVVIGYMANDILPARIGELVRAYVLGIRENVRKTATLATILVERIFDGLTMVGFAATAILFIILLDNDALTTGADHKLGTFLQQLSTPVVIGSVLFLGLLIVFLVVASSRDRTERLARAGLRFLPGRLHERVERLLVSFIDGLGSLRSPSSMASVLGLSILAWLFEAGMYYVIGMYGFDLRGSDGQPLPLYVYVMTTAFANLGLLIPGGPGGVGIFEAIGKAVLVGAFGVAPDPAISYVLVLHATLLIPVTLLGFYYMARQSLSYGDLVKLEQTRAEASRDAHELEGPLTDIELTQQGRITAGEAEGELERAGENK
ncbi:MAG: lysylphosphatidylglycerol synthase transmembrane domain-containing protein [Chloroflexota bacterium]